MGLTDLFSKLIVEHGSAEVQAKHIALFKDQLAMADKKTTLLESENTVLKTENEKLKSDLKESQKVTEILRSEIQKHQNPPHDNLLEQQKVDILLCLSKGEDAEPEHIARSLNIGKQVVTFHLEELSEKSMAYVNYIMGGSYWSLDQEGRRYLIKNNLIT